MRMTLTIAASILAATSAQAQAQSVRTLNGVFATSGTLKPNDPRTEAQQPYDEYRLRLEAGQRARVSANSDDFDTVVEVYHDGDTGEPLAKNDDAGEGLHSQVNFAADRTGVYRVRVLTFDASGKGKYNLRVEPLPGLPAPVTAGTVTTSTMRWTTFEGRLTGEDPASGETHFDDYKIALREGEEAIIRLESAEFDPVVQLFPGNRRDGEPLASNDDGGGETNSLLVYEAPSAGDYIVRVTSFGDGTGSYKLRVGQ